MLRCLFNFIVVSSALRISYIPNSCCFKMFKSPCILLFNNAFHSIVNIVEVLNIDNDTIFREGTPFPLLITDDRYPNFKLRKLASCKHIAQYLVFARHTYYLSLMPVIGQLNFM